MRNKSDHEAPSSFYKTYFLNEPKNEYRIEDYLYKPSTEPVVSSTEPTKKIASNSIPFAYSSYSTAVIKPLEKDIKSKSTVEYSDLLKKRSSKKKIDDENRLLNIIKDLKVTLESYLANGTSNSLSNVEVKKKNDANLLDFLVSKDLKSPINSVHLDEINTKNHSSSLNSTIEDTIEKLEIIY